MTPASLKLRAGLFAVATVLVTLLGAWLLFGRGPLPIQTDLLAMLPATEQNPLAEAALDQLAKLRGLDVHTSVIVGSVDEGIFRQLGIQITSEPVFQSKKLYQKR